MDKNIQKEIKDEVLSSYVDRLRESKGANRDTQGLGVMEIGSFLVGGVDAINGTGGEEVPDFVVTRHELMQLAKYWASERLEVDFDYFVDQCTGSSEWRWSKYITRRLDRLADLLAPDEMRNCWDAAVEVFRKPYPGVSDEIWHIFRNGSPEEQETWRDKAFRKQKDVNGEPPRATGEASVGS